LTEGTYRTGASASSKLSGVYIGPLIRHCLRGKRGPRVQALRVPYSHGYSRAPRDSPTTSGHCYTSGGGLLHSRGDYCAPGCRLLSSSVQPYPQEVRQPLPQCLQPFKGPTSSFERLQQRLSKMLARVRPQEWNYANSEAIAAGGQTPSGKLLAWCPRSLKSAIAFLEDLKNFRRYSDRG
jgi:hypothetical protein